MPVTPAEVALGLFTACNTARVLAYLPQIMKISRDQQGATAISYATWGLFGVSHLSTVAYALLVVEDTWMAVVFAVNLLACLIIIGLTAWKRALFRATKDLIAVAPVEDAPLASGRASAFFRSLAGGEPSTRAAPRRLTLIEGYRTSARA